MPKLVKDDRSPITMAQVMKNRLEGTWSPAVVQNWRNNYWDTGDGSVRYTDGSGVMIQDADYLLELNPKTRLTPNRAVALGDRKFEKGKVLFLPKDRIAQVNGVYLTADQAKDSPEWQFLAREKENSGLLGAYVDMVFQATGNDTNMALYFGNPEEENSGRLWCIVSIIHGSDASGYNYFGYNDGRLVGVASETLGAQKNVMPNLETRIRHPSEMVIEIAGQRRTYHLDTE
ncbi:MAG: hypothetical protein KKG59_05780 [Nanoarchaeota archaeon]|nr:hypothetical protein [Nanoarchaeota archaeon]